NRGAGWDLSGGLPQGYSEEVVLNPKFDALQPGAEPMYKLQPAPKSGSHFFSSILNKLFPGSAAALPEWLGSIDVTALSVRFNTQSKDFHFDTEMDFGRNVHAAISFSSLRQEGAKGAGGSPVFAKRAGGVLTVLPATAKLDFEVELEIEG